MSNNKTGRKVKFPISFKLVSVITILMLLSLSLVTVLVSITVSKDVQLTAEDNNFAINKRSADETEVLIGTVRSDIFLLLDMLNIAGNSVALSRQTSAFFFERNQNVVSIVVPGTYELINSRYFLSNEIEVSLVGEYIKQIESYIERAEKGETFVLNAAPLFELPILALVYPWQEGGKEEAVIALFSTDSLSDTFGTGQNSSILVNFDGDLLISPDFDMVKAGINLSTMPLMQTLTKSDNQNEQTLYTDTDDIRYFGAYYKLSIGDTVVITKIPYDMVFEGVLKTTKRNIYLTICVLFASILFIWFFSKTLSNPLKKLTEAAREIQMGNFDTKIIDELDVKRRDEIGVLNESTIDEREFLNTFARFTNKGVAKAIARKEIDFEPHLKDITIFFSDIRGFTAISDGFNKRFGNDSPREIIGFLNDYMGRMVNCITLSHGNVDKFEGDAIMAVWGILRDDNLSYEALPDSNPTKEQQRKAHAKHVMEDAVNAIRGTIAMRYALMEYNKAAEAFTEAHKNDAMAKYKPHIRVGCGLNTGRATAGIMGSVDKMEYTAIGDAVNLASRTESSNKPCGTDILLTEDTYNLLKNDFIRNESNNFSIAEENRVNEIVVEQIPVVFEVKGKGKQHFYGVVNMPNFDIEEFFRGGDASFVADKDCMKAVGPTGPKSLAEVRELLGIPTPEFEKVNLDEEENKCKIEGQ